MGLSLSETAFLGVLFFMLSNLTQIVFFLNILSYFGPFDTPTCQEHNAVCPYKKSKCFFIYMLMALKITTFSINDCKIFYRQLHCNTTTNNF